MNYLPYKVDEEIVLKEFSGHSASRIYELVMANQLELSKWFGWAAEMNSEKDVSEYIFEFTSKVNSGGHLGCEIWYLEELVGAITIHNGDLIHNKAEIGYWLASEYQGKGVMTRACHAIIDLGFSQLKLNRLAIKTAPENLNSSAVCERLGFSEEGIERQGMKLEDGYADLTVYSILKSEWEANRAQYLN